MVQNKRNTYNFTTYNLLSCQEYATYLGKKLQQEIIGLTVWMQPKEHIKSIYKRKNWVLVVWESR